MGFITTVLSDHEAQVRDREKYSALASIHGDGGMRIMDRQNKEVRLNQYEVEELIAFLATNYPSPMFRASINEKAALPKEID